MGDHWSVSNLGDTMGRNKENRRDTAWKWEQVAWREERRWGNGGKRQGVEMSSSLLPSDVGLPGEVGRGCMYIGSEDREEKWWPYASGTIRRGMIHVFLHGCWVKAYPPFFMSACIVAVQDDQNLSAQSTYQNEWLWNLKTVIKRYYGIIPFAPFALLG